MSILRKTLRPYHKNSHCDEIRETANEALTSRRKSGKTQPPRQKRFAKALGRFR